MTPYFFLNYEGRTDDKYLKKFLEKLYRALRDKGATGTDQEIGFRDTDGIGHGELWAPAILEALQTSSSLLTLMSPAYFNSDYCARELQFFRRRLGTPEEAGGRIHPVLWTRIEGVALPPVLGDHQYTIGDRKKIWNVSGVQYMFQKTLRGQIVDYIDALATALVHAHNRPLARLANPPLLATLPGLTASGPDSEDADATLAELPIGPNHVRFVYVAANPARFTGQVRNPEPYKKVGGADWKPFYPTNTTRIGVLAQREAAKAELEFTSDELVLTDQLLNEVDEAWNRRQIVVLVVDGWSVHWDQKQRNLLRALDSRLDYHWCVLVPWNNGDPEVAKNEKAILSALRTAFGRHMDLVGGYYRGALTSPDDFGRALRELLTQLKERIRSRAEIDAPLPDGPAKAVIVGPSSTVGPKN